MTADGLFPAPERVGVIVPDTETPGERKRRRHLAALEQGRHPLSLALGSGLPLHRDARRDGDRVDDGSPRCGGCVHRVVEGGRSKPYPKCHVHPERVSRRALPYERDRADENGRVWFTEYPRATRGEGTDVPAWWPACHDYTPPEETPDAD